MPIPSSVHVDGPAELDYTVVERDGKWCLVSKGGGKVLGCHDSRAGAEAQEKAVQANKSKEFSVLELSVEQMRELCGPCADKMEERGISRLKLDTSKENLGIKEASDQLKSAVQRFGLNETHNIKGVEIFSIGEWNGDKYTSADLDELVSAFRETKQYLKPYLKLGHGEDQTLIRADELPNVGRVSAVYRKGDKLLADFERMPRKVYEVVAAGAYDRLSCEIYSEARVNGKVYPLALKAIGLLGGETPAVENLDDVIALFSTEDGVLEYGKGVKLRVHLFGRLPAGEDNMECKEQLEAAKKELDEYKKKSMSLEADIKKFSDEAAAAKAQAEAAVKENESLKSGKAEAEKKFAEASVALDKVASEKRQAQAAAKVSELINSKKLLPAQKESFTGLLINAMAAGVRKYRLGDKEVEKAEADVLLEFIEKGGEGLSTDEESETGKSTKVNDLHGPEFAREVREYADKHKVSYRDAHTALVAQRAGK